MELNWTIFCHDLYNILMRIRISMQLCAGEHGENWSLHQSLFQLTGFDVSALREQQAPHYGPFQYWI